uniref:DUF6606 domain-containing protein n=1 Tax=Coccidioides posadasii RMSCC 3488 TaxID=454284 RepID=A0A0J6FQA9_COCPO|nr:hypothetical protein CPAG_07943 [Coccidioides posadasii RMSCC 3488]
MPGFNRNVIRSLMTVCHLKESQLWQVARRKEISNFIFNNVIFPPQLPQSGDAEARPACHSVADMLENLKAISEQDLISEIDLVQVLENLNGSRAMMCFIRAQNCGWLMQSDAQARSVIVDAFEASPSCEDVLKSKGPLGPIFPWKKLEKTEFQEYLARELSRLSREQVDEMVPIAGGAGQGVLFGLLKPLPSFARHGEFGGFRATFDFFCEWNNDPECRIDLTIKKDR